MATMVSMPLLHPADLAVARSMPSIHVAPHGAVINFYTASGTQSVRGTGQAGIGLFFEKEEYDGSITAAEIGTVLRSMGQNPTNDELNAMVSLEQFQQCAADAPRAGAPSPVIPHSLAGTVLKQQT